MRASEKIQRWKNRFGDSRPFLSLEVFPPKTPEGILNLTARLSRFARFHPLWVNVTWGAGGGTRDTTMTLCSACLDVGLDPIMHLTCQGSSRAKILEVLTEAKGRGIQNIFALRGDPPKGAPRPTPEEIKAKDELTSAAELVTFIKENFGDYFCVGVAAYPEKHPESASIDEDTKFLKAKVDAGAELIFTQFFQDTQKFVDLVTRAREAGIKVPIIPGILPISNYDTFKRITGMCGTTVPPRIDEGLEAIKGDEELVKKFGIAVAIEMGRDMLAERVCEGVHLYTMNTEATVTAIIEGLGIIPIHRAIRAFPWTVQKPSSVRESECVRPIHWRLRPLSYVERTRHWHKFPMNESEWAKVIASDQRFIENLPTTAGNSPVVEKEVDNSERTFVFGEYKENRTGISFAIPKDTDGSRRRAAWGSTIANKHDLIKPFYAYLRCGAPGSHLCAPCSTVGSVEFLPWRPAGFPNADANLLPYLISLSSLGVCPINWNQKVDCALATDPNFGYSANRLTETAACVSQNEYIEFFVSPDLWEKLEPQLSQCFQGDSNIAYFASQYQNKTVCYPSTLENVSMVPLSSGTFDNEVIYPLMTNLACFNAWKSEAFSLWVEEWGSILSDDASKQKIENEVMERWYLVSMFELKSSKKSHLMETLCDCVESLRFGEFYDHVEITNCF